MQCHGIDNKCIDTIVILGINESLRIAAHNRITGIATLIQEVLQIICCQIGLCT